MAKRRRRDILIRDGETVLMESYRECSIGEALSLAKAVLDLGSEPVGPVSIRIE